MARLMYRMHAKICFSYLEGVYGSHEIKAMKKGAVKNYREMLGRTASMGKYSILIFMPAVLFSISRSAEGAMDEDVFAGMTDHLAHSPLFLKMATQRTLFTEKFHEKTKKNAELSQSSLYPMNWKFTHEKINPDEYITTYTRCGVCELAKQEDCFNLAKYLCKIDFITYDRMGAVLDRSMTIADGDAVCDFHVLRKP